NSLIISRFELNNITWPLYRLCYNLNILHKFYGEARMYLTLPFFVLVLTIIALPAQAKDLAKCEGLNGYAYFMNTEGTDTKETGWDSDVNAKGKIILKTNEDGKFDLLYLDPTNVMMSSI